MLTVGVAIRLGRRPAEVATWPIEELAAVAAYCEIEAEQLNRNAPTAPQPQGAQVQRLVFHAAPRERKR